MIMQSTKFHGWMRAATILTAALASNAMVSCSDDFEPATSENIEVIEPGGITMPTEERIKVPVAIISSDGSELYAALAKRCELRGDLSSPTLGVVVTSSTDLAANTAAIVAAYDAGAIVVVTNPDDEKVASWCNSTGIPYIGDGSCESGHGHLLYCFNNNNDFYFLDDFLDESPDNDHETVLNSFTTWVNTYSSDSRSKAKNSANRLLSRSNDFDIARTFASQTIAHTYQISIVNGELAHVKWSKVDRLTKKSTIDVAYKIYPLHSFNANPTKGDFYIVSASATVHNGNMFNGQWTKKHGGVRARLGGFYLSQFNLDATLCTVSPEGNGFKYITCPKVTFPADGTPQPETTQNKTSYQSGFNWGINGSISGGINGKDPTAQISLGGNFGWNNSETRTISDLTIETNTTNGKVGHVCHINNLPHTSKGRINTDIPEIAKSDFTIYQSWIWHVEDAADYSDNTYGIRINAKVEYKGYHWYSSAADFSEKTFSNALPQGTGVDESEFCATLIKPNRVPHGRLVMVNTSNTHQYLHSIKIWKSATPKTKDPDYTINQTIASSFATSSSAITSAMLSLPEGEYYIEAIRCNIKKDGVETDRVEVQSRNNVKISLAQDTNIDGGSIDFKPKSSTTSKK